MCSFAKGSDYHSVRLLRNHLPGWNGTNKTTSFYFVLSILKLNDIVKSSHMRKHYKHHVGAANFLFLFFFLVGGFLYVCLGIELIFFLSLAGMRHSMTSLIVGVLEVACFAAFPCSHLYLPYRTDEQ